MKKIFITIIAFSCFNILNACDLNIDSLFSKHISKLKEKEFTLLKLDKNDSILYAHVEGRDEMSFLHVAYFLFGFDFDPHSWLISEKSIFEIEEWYYRKRAYITCEHVEKAYSLLIYEESSQKNIENWIKNIENLRIE